MPLTVKKARDLKTPGKFLDANGLYLQVSRSLTKSWLFRYERDGRDRWYGLGSLHTFGLEEARELARKARQQLREGIDPIDERAARTAARRVEAARAVTFEEAARRFYATRSPQWKSAKHRTQFLASLTNHAFPIIGHLPVAAIDIDLVLKCLEPIWASKTETATRVRQRIEAVLDWATALKLREGDNPADWKRLSKVLDAPTKIAKVKHHPALPFDEVGAFVVQISARPSIVARAMEFLILTAARTSEVTGARWSEMDLTEKVWTIPAARMKAGKEHRVPLSKRAVSLLEEMPRESDYVFPGGKTGEPMSNMAMAMMLKRMGRDDIVVHGFRATFRTWASERTNFPHDVVEQSLAHSVGSAVERAYRRGDVLEKRRALMETWAKFAASPRAVDSGKVVPLRKA